MYQTGAWNEPFLHFPAGRRLALVHNLNGTPRVIRTYLAFSECPYPVDATKPGVVAESAGNQVILEGIQSDTIRVRNDTCADLYLRLVATHPDGENEPEAGAGGDGAIDASLETASAQPGGAGAGGSAEEYNPCLDPAR